MGGGGFSLDAVKVIRANRAFLKKRRSYSDIRAEYEDLTSKTQLKFKELTPFQQKLIRNNIRSKAKQDKIYNLWVTAIGIVGVVSVFAYLYIKYMA